MNDVLAETLSKPALLAAEPQLFVTDVAASCEFYTKKLGFTVAFIYGEPPFYGQVFRDGARLNIRHLDEPAINPELRDREQLLSASITVDDAKPLFLEFQTAGVLFHQTLKTESWGACTFIVRDPDGNLILFSGGGRWSHRIGSSCYRPSDTSNVAGRTMQFHSDDNLIVSDAKSKRSG